MDDLKKKYENCCKLCFTTIYDKPVQLSALPDLTPIKELMGDAITAENADYAIIIKSSVCSMCVTRLSEFLAYRSSCLDKFRAFQKEFETAKVTKKYVCEFCFKYYAFEEILNTHKENSHRKNNKTSDMDMDLSCGQLTITPEKTNGSINDNDTGFECPDCHRKFAKEDHLIYLSHCRNVHPKKVPCPFGCMIDRKDGQPQTREKKKMFKNLHFLAKHIYTQHAELVAHIKTEKSKD